MADHRSYAIGAFLLAPAERRLTRNGAAIPLTPKAFDTLLFLVERRGRLIQKSEFMQVLWPDTFVEDVTLARQISALRKALGDGADGTEFIETVPKSGYRLVAPVKVLDDGDVEVTTESTADGASTQPPIPSIGRGGAKGVAAGTPVRSAAASHRMALGIAAAGVVMLVGTWGWTRTAAGRHSQAATVQSIAVLPFKALGKSEAVLELGLADTLIARLNRSPLIVRPISAVRQYVDPRTDAVAAGRALKVDAVLDGTVQQSSDRVRITATLRRVRDGIVLWSGSFDDRADNVFTAEDSIAVQVASAIVPRLTTEAAERLTLRATSRPEAMREYLLGRFFWNRHDGDGLRKAVDHFERAIELDPEYALAYAGLADAYLLVRDYDLQHDTVPRARAAALRALELDPTLAEAHTSLALVATNFEWDWAEAGRRYRRAIELSPNYAVAHAWYGEYLAFMGRFEEGYAENLRAQELDPVALFIRNDAAKILWLWRKYDRVLAAARQALELDPTSATARFGLVGAYVGLGRYAEAIHVMDDPVLPNDDPAVVQSRVVAYAAAGKAEEAHAEFARLIELSKTRDVAAQTIARAAVAIGDYDRAFVWLNRMCDERAAGPIGLKVDPAFDPMRQDPRYDQLLRRVGFAQ
jgi:DNA-binding winged helix-turn-helix (wHTH) protein/TolB-like protein/Tfp pilus assembly protein PilF